MRAIVREGSLQVITKTVEWRYGDLSVEHRYIACVDFYEDNILNKVATTYNMDVTEWIGGGHKPYMPIEFDTWVSLLIALAPEYRDAGTECWKDAYWAGKSPRQAIAEDKSNA